MKIAYLQTCVTRADGSKDTFRTIELPARERILPWQAAGLTWTASGYGKRIPSRWQVKYNGRWRRVYVCQYSNIGTAYIGRLRDNLIVQEVGHDSQH